MTYFSMSLPFYFSHISVSKAGTTPPPTPTPTVEKNHALRAYLKPIYIQERQSANTPLCTLAVQKE